MFYKTTSYRNGTINKNKCFILRCSRRDIPHVLTIVFWKL